jgi:hypothetical protein
LFISCDLNGNPFPGQDVPPDYLNDLNAMHEAETVLNPEQLSEYYIQLASAMFRPFRASAAQRAEALLRTLGKWKEASK